MEELPGGTEANNHDLDLAVTESSGTKWTDEKHDFYLNFMEALFVKKLRNNRCNSNKTFNSTTPLHPTWIPSSAPKVHYTDSVAEVSDQNFVDTEEEELDERPRKKPATSVNLSAADQVVPFMRSRQEEKNERGKGKIFGRYKA